MYARSLLLFALISFPLFASGGSYAEKEKMREEERFPRFAAAIEKTLPEIMRKYHNIVLEASWEFGVSARLIIAVMLSESLGNPRAHSHADARGLMQTLPALDKEVGIYGDSFNPRTSIRKGAKYLLMLKERYKLGTMKRIVFGYQYGPGAARKASEARIARDPYVRSVMFAYRKILELIPPAEAAQRR